MADERPEAGEEELESVEPTDGQAAEDVAQENANDVAEAGRTVLDERVEAAVRHVAEEAAADQAAAAAKEGSHASKKRERRSRQARATKEEKVAENVNGASTPEKTGGLAGLGTGAWIGIAVACLALGLVLGRFALGGGAAAGGAAALSGVTSVTEEQLDNAFATYTYNGEEHTVTVREVIEQTTTLDAAVGEDGTYQLPSAEYALTVARNAVLLAEVEARGITVSDKDVAAYAEDNLGTGDFDAIASTYGMDAEMVKELIEQNCQVNALREEVVGTELPKMPDAPEAAAEGEEDKATKAYAKYIINLAGDEWDKKADTWASKDGRYATALADYDVTSKGATYAAANAAYYVAYQIYTEKQTEVSQTWTDFYNGLMSKASIQLNTLVS